MQPFQFFVADPGVIAYPRQVVDRHTPKTIECPFEFEWRFVGRQIQDCRCRKHRHCWQLHLVAWPLRRRGCRDLRDPMLPSGLQLRIRCPYGSTQGWIERLDRWAGAECQPANEHRLNWLPERGIGGLAGRTRTEPPDSLRYGDRR